MVLRNVCSALAALTLCTSATSLPLSAADFRTAVIDDQAVSMPAYSVKIPAGWKFDGAVFQGPQCDPLPYPVYRAYSADGLSEMRTLPRFDWTFNSAAAPGQSNQCLPLGRPLDASAFLNYYAGLIHAKYVGPMSVAPDVQQRVDAYVAKMNQSLSHIPGFHQTGTIVAARVETKNGTFTIEQRLRVFASCHSQQGLRGTTATGCFARIDVLRAPKGKLDALARTVDENGLNLAPSFPAYQQRQAQIVQQRGNEELAELRGSAERGNRMLRQQFEQSMALQQHEHEQFMAQMQASTDSSMQNAMNSMNARSTSTSDWVDYALDRQTVTGSGGTAKVSSAYGITWANGQGQYYQTNDPNANPNGVLGGNWTPK